MPSKVQIKTIRALQHKKYRQKFDQFIVEGVKNTLELLKSDHIEVKILFVTPKYLEKYPVLLEQDGEVEVVDEKTLKKISCLSTPQGILGICQIPTQSTSLPLNNKITLMLDGVRNPGNLGTIIRIADWFGIENIIYSPDCVDPFNPKTVQATMGSIGRIKLWKKDLTTVLQENNTLSTYAATLKGTPLTQIEKLEEGIILIGNESNGINPELLTLIRKEITIPKIGEAESLNAAVATGIICGRLLL